MPAAMAGGTENDSAAGDILVGAEASISGEIDGDGPAGSMANQVSESAEKKLKAMIHEPGTII